MLKEGNRGAESKIKETAGDINSILNIYASHSGVETHTLTTNKVMRHSHIVKNSFNFRWKTFLLYK